MGLTFTKLFTRFPQYGGGRHRQILMIGLDGAGKTTILHRLMKRVVVTSLPTIGFNVETIRYRDFSLCVWDVGGQDKIRSLWRHYYQGTTGLIFVVDSCDQERMGVAKAELTTVLDQQELHGVPLLVFANKQDLPGASAALDVAAALGLQGLVGRRWHVQSASGVEGSGLFEGLGWLAGNLDKPAGMRVALS